MRYRNTYTSNEKNPIIPRNDRDNMADDKNNSDVGLMMTVYAWTVMIMSLPAMLATGDMERKGLLLKLFVIFIIGHIISVIAWNYWILLIARISNKPLRSISPVASMAGKDMIMTVQA